MDAVTGLSCERQDRTVEVRERIEEHAAFCIVALPETIPIVPCRYRALAVLAHGQALVCRMSVASNGDLDAELFVECDGEPITAAALISAVWPSLQTITAANAPHPLLLVSLAPESRETSGSGAFLLQPRDSVPSHSVLAPETFEWPWSIGKALQLFAAGGGGVLQIAFRATERDAVVVRRLGIEREACLAATYRHPEDRRLLARLAAVDAMRDDPGLIAVEIGYSAVLSLVQRDLMAIALFGVKASMSVDPEPTLFGTTRLPSRIMPTQGEARLLRSASGVAPIDESAIELGRVTSTTPLRFGERDRMRHLYVLGATGTGKSTLMRRLAEQDMTQDEGVILIDPHGDLAREVAQLVPATRQKDLIFADADAETLVLPMLPDPDEEGGIERAVDGLVSLFTDVLYDGSKDAFGPIFEQYFRHALTLVVHALPELRRLSTLPAIFEDRALRRTLLGTCPVDACTSFWTNTAERTSGDYALANFTPYITAKLTRLISSHPARAIFASPHAPIDFRAAMDEGKILVIRCAKGSLGEGLSRLSVATSLLKIREALMARAEGGLRRPVRLYLDEFQGLRGGELAMLLAEGRKFGVSITLANQSLGQIGGVSDGSLGAAILANAGSLLLFRLGAPDAARLAPWIEADADWRSLCRLPDFRMAARVLTGGIPRYFPDLGLPAPLAAAS